MYRSIFQVQDLEKFDFALEDQSIPHREYLPTHHLKEDEI